MNTLLYKRALELATYRDRERPREESMPPMTDVEGFIDFWLQPTLDAFRFELKQAGYVLDDADRQFLPPEYFLEYAIAGRGGRHLLWLQGQLSGSAALAIFPMARGSRQFGERGGLRGDLQDGTNRHALLAELVLLTAQALPE